MIKRIGYLFGLLLLATSPFAAQPLDTMNGVCSKKNLAASGEFRQFNEWQCDFAYAKLRTTEQQKGNTCVCEALANVHHEYRSPSDKGKPILVESFAHLMPRKCINSVFHDVFNSHNEDLPRPPPGKVFGGFGGVILTGSLTSSISALSEILDAVGQGRIAAVSLASYPLYSHLRDRGLVPESANFGKGDRHTVVIRAVISDQNGKITHAIILDSNTPFPIYAVPVHVLTKAYKSISARLSRGVYISNAVRQLNSQ